jgi:hypothetical protein
MSWASEQQAQRTRARQLGELLRSLAGRPLKTTEKVLAMSVFKIEFYAQADFSTAASEEEEQ